MKVFTIALALFTLLFTPAPATAQTRDPDASMKRMQTVLSILNQELVAIYDQLKALQAALAASDRSSLHIQGLPPALTSEEEVAAAKRKAIAREQQIQAQIDAAFSRIKDIEAQKQPILRRLQDSLDSEQETEAAKARSR